MTDQELLELAARAVGIDVWFPRIIGKQTSLEPCHQRVGDEISVEWNPLQDNDDAFRLAVKLHIEIGYDTTDNEVFAVGADELGWETESCDTDPYAATRRAIVRAAATIGKQMEGL